MIVDPDFLTHWRTLMLIDELDGDEMAPLYVIRLWGHCQQRRSDAFDMPPAGLKALCRYKGEPDHFEAAMVSAGFLRRDEGMIYVTKWMKHNASLVKNWTNGASGGRPKKTQQEPSGNPNETQTKPSDNPRLTQAEPIREEKSKPSISEQTTSTTKPCSAETTVSSSPPVCQDRGKTLAARLSKLEAKRSGKALRYSGADPRVKAWVAAGITDPQFREAYEIAVEERIAASDLSPVNPGFLDIFVAKVMNPSEAPSLVSGAEKAWHERKSGIEKKAAELGIPEYHIDRYPHGYPEFKARVFKAAGLQEAQ